MSLHLDGDLNENLLSILTNVCIDLQKQFDISPNLLNIWINTPGFQKQLEENHKIATEQSLIQREQAQAQAQAPVSGVAVLGNDSKMPPHGAPISNLGLESNDKCGKLLKSHDNGFLELCNEHKYLHEHLDHEFTHKSETQIAREQKFEQEWQRVNEYGRCMYERIWTYLQNYIRDHYKRERHPTSELERIRPLLEENERLFKSRIVVNQVTHSADSTAKYVYGPHFDLFIPK